MGLREISGDVKEGSEYQLSNSGLQDEAGGPAATRKGVESRDGERASGDRDGADTLGRAGSRKGDEAYGKGYDFVVVATLVVVPEAARVRGSPDQAAATDDVCAFPRAFRDASTVVTAAQLAPPPIASARSLPDLSCTPPRTLQRHPRTRLDTSTHAPSGAGRVESPARVARHLPPLSCLPSWLTRLTS